MTETKEAIFDPVGDARRQRRVLDLIPKSGGAFDAAARAAAVDAGLSEDVIAILDDQTPIAPRFR